MKYSLIAIFILSTKLFYAQAIDAKWGNEGKRITGIDATGNVISVDNESIIKLTGKKGYGGMSLEYFEAKREKLYDNCIITAHHTYFPVLIFTNPSGKENLSVVEVDSKGNIKGGLRKILEDDLSLKTNRTGKFCGSGGGLFVSENKQWVMKLTPTEIMTLGKPSKFTVTVMDENLNVVWRKEQEFEYADNNLTITNAVVTNSGKVVLTAQIPASSWDNGDYDYDVFYISKDSIKEGKFYANGKTINCSTDVVYENDGKIILGGHYVNKSNSDNAKAGYVNGNYMLGFDLDKCSVVSKESYPFDFATLKAMSGDSPRDAVKGISGLTPVVLLNQGSSGYLFLSDCSTAGIAYFADMVSGRHGPEVSQYGSYQKVLVGYDKQLKKKFELIIPTAGFISATHNTGVRAFALGDKILVLYSEGHSRAKKYSCMATVIDASGKILSNQEIDPGVQGYQYRPELSWQLNDNSIVVYLGASGADGRYSETKFKEAVITLK